MSNLSKLIKAYRKLSGKWSISGQITTAVQIPQTQKPHNQAICRVKFLKNTFKYNKWQDTDLYN